MDGRLVQQTSRVRRQHRGVVSLLQDQTAKLQLPLHGNTEINHSAASGLFLYRRASKIYNSLKKILLKKKKSVRFIAVQLQHCLTSRIETYIYARLSWSKCIVIMSTAHPGAH